MTIICLLLLATLLPILTFTAHVNVGIVNGKEVKPHSRPYMVSVQYNGQHKCGGFLISNEFVLTAAHCRNKSQIFTAVVGAHDLRNKSENSVRFKVNSYHEHPNYNNKTYHNDIMLLRLEKKVTQNNNVDWISLPKTEGDIEAGSVCSVAGWGALKTNGTLSPTLMETNVKIMQNKKCENKWGKEFSASKMICVYGDGGSCAGDSGGPLVYEYTAVGVTSFGDIKQCNSLKYPEVYTKISAFLPWIHNTTGNVN
ncbi:granzyme B-like isoform X1 [Myxocyprinus asiaticus]|uniref:granzyme B-like isoform X1 n=1 Tax=Myxocyprinus asiaticus TaxID=70543 RepID=UPI00222296DE|nr:granzyme B-like isoform X1 [Myxocyprinus asiaticus]XP_051549122.1 granzyme B-like isoform X1 [Myxocyprinus asiaticus]XP_051549123.1 granzyme B-like isoform X1 [Myxocyprinus asiaticus]XP_051549124.1 granzyme B-like isoform X1 [Myxocyprinus asiaticus]XP_051549125.1 granzyme B-like isoform X1 [Myxocyprinus asiaticus]